MILRRSLAYHIIVNQDIQNLYNDIEKDLLSHIILNMQQRKISTEDAQKLAREFLALLPAKDKEDLLNKLKNLGEKYPEAKSVYVKYYASEDEEQRQNKLQGMLEHVRAGNIEQAINVAKGVNQ